MDKLNPDDPRSHYLQIADALGAEIRGGAYRAGDKLPAHHEIAEHFGVSIGTVKRAYAQLQEDQLIVTRQGQGSFVRALEPDASPEESDVGLEGVYDQLATIRQLVDSVERQLRAHG